MMLDIQKERLRQLMASAILELWKKETGSLASVFIEATVCITSCNSRMTVIQLSDHFPGLIPEPPPLCMERSVQFHSAGNDVSKSSAVGRLCHVTGQKRKLPVDPHDQLEKAENGRNGGGVSGNLEFVEKLKGGATSTNNNTTRLDLDLHQYQRLRMDSNNNQTGMADAEADGDCSEETDKEEISSEESDPCEGSASDMEELRNSPSQNLVRMGLVIPGTGYYTYAKPASLTTRERNSPTKADPNDSAIQDMSAGSLIIDTSSNEDDNSATDVKGLPASEAKWKHGSVAVENGCGQKNGGVDLSQHDADLVISSPQNYTEQVRDVIRNRLLLNEKQKAGKSAGDIFPGGSSGLVSEAPAAVLGRSFDVSPSWPLIKREKSNVLRDTRVLQHHHHHHQQQQQQHFASPPLPLVPLRKNFLDTLTASSIQVSHQSLQKLFGFSNNSNGIGLTESKAFSDSMKEPEPDETQQSFPGLNLQFPDQKPGKTEDGGTASSTEQKTYKCGFCHKTFLFKSKYHEHLPVHTSARPFECHMCTRTYKYKYDLRVHLRTHLGIPTKSTICPFCSGKFLTNKLLRHHIREAHREQQQISEEQCAQSLDSLPSLSPNVSSA